MQIRSPQRTEAMVWNQQFNQHLQAWIASQRQDTDAFDGALGDLRNLLEREPDAAGYVANILSTLTRHHAEALSPGELKRTAMRGLEAIRLVTEDSELRTLTRCNLLNYLARAYMDLGRFGDALQRAEMAWEALNEQAPFQSAVSGLLEIQSMVLVGQAREALLDYERACDEYVEAEKAASEIAGNPQQLSAIVSSMVEFEFPHTQQLPEEIIKAQISMLWRKLSKLRIAAASGAGRCAVIADTSSVDERLLAFIKTADAHGVGDISALEIAPMIQAASSEVASSAVTSLLVLVEKLGLDSTEYGGILNAALSTCDLKPELRADARAFALDQISEIADTPDRAGIYAMLLVGAEDGDSRARFVDGFVDTLIEIGHEQDERLAHPSNRLMFDEPVLISLQDLCARGEGTIPWEPALRTVIAQLVDYDFTGLTPLDDWLGITATEPVLEDVLVHARDRFARMNNALRNWDGTLALIMRSVGHRTLFLALDGSEQTVAVISEKDYAKRARDLAIHMQDEIEAVSRQKKLGPVEQVQELGAAAYQSMPAEIRDAIDHCKRLLVCPDHRMLGGSVPFELFYDGSEWLGVSKEIARFPSLRTQVACLEGTGRRDPNRRVLSLAVPEVVGWPELKLARDEAEKVRASLEGDGWDAPVVDQERVSPDYVLDRLSYTSHLHIAAHGEAQGAEEFLVLSEGDLLAASDLMRRFVPRMPTAYINACEVGASRWAGAGRAQSIPYAFITAGSSAVIANLLQVEDNVSSKLASSFYKNAREASFGESLKVSRAALAEAGVHPVFWGSTVLMGDPDATLSGGRSSRSVSENYLDAIVLGRDEESKQAAVDAARASLITDADDVRLQAAIGLINAMQDEALLNGEYGFGAIASACRVAYEVDHLPVLGFLVYMASLAINQVGSNEQRLRFYDNAINLIEPLEQEGDTWKRMLDKFLVKWLGLVRGNRMAELQYQGPDTEDKEQLMAEVQSLTDIQFAMEARAIRYGFGAISRDEESNADDVLWNAVVLSRDHQLEGMRERYDFARKIVEKLRWVDALAEDVAEDATIAFAGLLNWLWRSQNQVSLTEEMINGQRGVLGELLSNLQQSWRKEPWFERLLEFESGMHEGLASLEDLPYDDKLYERIDEVIAEIDANAEQVLQEAAEESPEILCRSTVWVLGSLIRVNTYSYLDGSVPESICERLTRVQEHLDGYAEAKIYPWLDRGFHSVRETKPDELKRWRYGLGQPGADLGATT